MLGQIFDPMAVEVARENLALNKVDEEKAKAYAGDLVTVVQDKKFDIVVANILSRCTSYPFKRYIKSC